MPRQETSKPRISEPTVTPSTRPTGVSPAPYYRARVAPRHVEDFDWLLPTVTAGLRAQAEIDATQDEEAYARDNALRAAEALDDPEVFARIQANFDGAVGKDAHERSLKALAKGVETGIFPEIQSPQGQIDLWEGGARSLAKKRFAPALEAQFEELIAVVGEDGIQTAKDVDSAISEAMESVSGNVVLANTYGAREFVRYQEAIVDKFRERVTVARAEQLTRFNRDSKASEVGDLVYDIAGGIREVADLESFHDTHVFGKHARSRALTTQGILGGLEEVAQGVGNEAAAQTAQRLLSARVGQADFQGADEESHELRKALDKYLARAEADDDKEQRERERAKHNALSDGESYILRQFAENQDADPRAVGDRVIAELGSPSLAEFDSVYGELVEYTLSTVERFQQHGAPTSDPAVKQEALWLLGTGELDKDMVRAYVNGGGLSPGDGSALLEKLDARADRDFLRSGLSEYGQARTALQGALPSAGFGHSLGAQADTFTSEVVREFDTALDKVISEATGSPSEQQAQVGNWIRENQPAFEQRLRDKREELRGQVTASIVPITEFHTSNRSATDAINTAFLDGVIDVEQRDALFRQDNQVVTQARQLFYHSEEAVALQSSIDDMIYTSSREAYQGLEEGERLRAVAEFEAQYRADRVAALDQIKDQHPNTESQLRAWNQWHAEYRRGLSDQILGSAEKKIAEAAVAGDTERIKRISRESVLRSREEEDLKRAVPFQTRSGALDPLVPSTVEDALARVLNDGGKEKGILSLATNMERLKLSVEETARRDIFNTGKLGDIFNGEELSEEDKDALGIQLLALQGLTPKQIIAGRATLRVSDLGAIAAQSALPLGDTPPAPPPKLEREITFNSLSINHYRIPVFRSLDEMKEYFPLDKEPTPQGRLLLERLGISNDPEVLELWFPAQARAIEAYYGEGR